MALIVFFKCHPLVISCSIKDKKAEFQYTKSDRFYSRDFSQHSKSSGSSMKPPESSFNYLCTLNDASDIEVFSNQDYMFKFYLIDNSDFFGDKSSNKLDLNLYKTLFQPNCSNNSRLSPVLLIGAKDGCLYWKCIENSTTNTSLNDNILFDTSSPIICINSFRFAVNNRNNRGDLFNKDSKNLSKINQSNDDNCLFVLTKSGRMHLFAFGTEYFYKVLVVPHYIKNCIIYKNRSKSKISNDYLVYSTRNNQIFSLKLDNCLKEALIKPKLLKTEIDAKMFFIGDFLFYLHDFI